MAGNGYKSWDVSPNYREALPLLSLGILRR